MSDIRLIVKNQELKTQKAILAVSSPVFSSVFEKMENRSIAIEINDFSHFEMKEILWFIYIAQVENLSDIAANLIYIAQKYDITDLRSH